MAHKPFKVGSADKIKGKAYNTLNGVRELLDLSGATVQIKVRINKGALKTWACDVEVDQAAHRGEFTYSIAGGGTPDIDKAGDVAMDLHVTIAGKVHFSSTVNRTAEASVALSAAA